MSEDDLKWSGMEFNKHHYLGKKENHAFYASEIKQDSNLLDNTEITDLRNLLGLLQIFIFRFVLEDSTS
ncbi:MAG: hypothetical protein Ct9H90mP4_09250 [Gammaproteobacteria bacterium]|nr:MAG: hypothetical protein Ct9H90mP4_09250 [Gammaproteobacteria bacterium]